MGRRLHLAQERVHFRLSQTTTCPDRTVTGHGAGDFLQSVLQRLHATQFHDLVRQVLDEASDIGLAE